MPPKKQGKQQLREMFPDVPASTIDGVMKSVGHDVNKALDYLVELGAEKKKPQEAPAPKGWWDTGAPPAKAASGSPTQGGEEKKKKKFMSTQRKQAAVVGLVVGVVVWLACLPGRGIKVLSDIELYIVRLLFHRLQLPAANPRAVAAQLLKMDWRDGAVRGFLVRQFAKPHKLARPNLPRLLDVVAAVGDRVPRFPTDLSDLLLEQLRAFLESGAERHHTGRPTAEAEPKKRKVAAVGAPTTDGMPSEAGRDLTPVSLREIALKRRLQKAVGKAYLFGALVGRGVVSVETLCEAVLLQCFYLPSLDVAASTVRIQMTCGMLSGYLEQGGAPTAPHLLPAVLPFFAAYCLAKPSLSADVLGGVLSVLAKVGGGASLSSLAALEGASLLAVSETQREQWLDYVAHLKASAAGTAAGGEEAGEVTIADIARCRVWPADAAWAARAPGATFSSSGKGTAPAAPKKPATKPAAAGRGRGRGAVEVSSHEQHALDSYYIGALLDATITSETANATRRPNDAPASSARGVAAPARGVVRIRR
eukprot:TRINITY_DN1254_c0_g2_i1.p1 TRINITY_DN1254_c0_g2~~TRINITY_DN1254_c0_g2_i1.p1  ORF type:complete len:535 (+),score=183.22 TRINITY_DN1254_c0_g2_i1:121-1725(+)